MIRCLLIILLGLPTLYANNYPVKLGDQTVIIHQEHHNKGKNFIHVHQNEKTALKAARKVIESQGGSLMTLIHSGGRNIVFYLHHKRYEFDPNRIFTDRGIKKTLMKYGNYSSEAHRAVKKLATKIIALLPQGKLIAVHNNRSYSLKNYLPGKQLARDAHALNYPAKRHHRNFFLVTKKKDYMRLKHLRLNSVLQRRHPTDDGSLSVYFSQKNYINVEAGYDQLPQQIKMLKKA